jgi:hypothetical protein
MENQEKIGNRQELPPWMQAARSEFVLRSEVAFWRELIRDSGEAVPPASLERMQQALALAESRLRQLYAVSAVVSR